MRYLIIALALALTTACGKVNMNIEELDTPSSQPEFANVSTSEFVSASNSPRALTGGGYRVTASAGYMTEKNKVETTANQYKVYFGVNGQIISEQ